MFVNKPEPLIFELSAPDRKGVLLPISDVSEIDTNDLLPEDILRNDLPLPEVSEVDVVRHFVQLSQKNFSIDTGLYPLGSCTMKYNPKINERIARLPGFEAIHPLQPEDTCQGALELMYTLSVILAEIGGMDAVTLQPAAGALGELTGMLMIRAYHERVGDRSRQMVIIPDSAHGTNPATAARCGYQISRVPSNERGTVDTAKLKELIGPHVAAIMLTNPNTLGLFEDEILEISDMIHGCGALMYCDGANMNAILGKARPGDMGFDVMHFNLHKTFSTPHGGGGPGAGPVGVKEFLKPFLPAPVIEETDGYYKLNYDKPQSIGRVHSFYGNFNILVRALAYILSLGPDGLKAVSETAVLNANYVRNRLLNAYDVPYGSQCMHEFVASARRQKAHGVRALDIAKRIIDYGFHPPTIYFPLIVEEALMIEPVETESLETLNAFIDALLQIDKESIGDPDIVKNAPHEASVGRLDEALAARRLDVRWTPPGD
ncbi:MAG: aminomethyl-transferring glycine dehydrogenase subunit GcvPB [Armatimonadota bacterium]|nr:aminomethyl-transferring glycine dehydrogenase subunit GcvPB [Armatimonadota bacterium]